MIYECEHMRYEKRKGTITRRAREVGGLETPTDVVPQGTCCISFYSFLKKYTTFTKRPCFPKNKRSFKGPGGVGRGIYSRYRVQIWPKSVRGELTLVASWSLSWRPAFKYQNSESSRGSGQSLNLGFASYH